MHAARDNALQQPHPQRVVRRGEPRVAPTCAPIRIEERRSGELDRGANVGGDSRGIVVTRVAEDAQRRARIVRRAPSVPERAAHPRKQTKRSGVRSLRERRRAQGGW